MKLCRVCDKVPLPICPSFDAWMKWALRVSDMMVETFPELSRASLESEALFCAVSTVVYKIPTGGLGDIVILTLHDVIYAAMEMLGVRVYLALSEQSSGLYRAYPTLYARWKAAMEQARITSDEFSAALDLDRRELAYWEQCGIHISSGTKAVVEGWLQVRGPWPIPLELREFCMTLT